MPPASPWALTPAWEGDADYEEEAGALDIPIHAFDVVIADECHRGYTAKDTDNRLKGAFLKPGEHVGHIDSETGAGTAS